MVPALGFALLCCPSRAMCTLVLRVRSQSEDVPLVVKYRSVASPELLELHISYMLSLQSPESSRVLQGLLRGHLCVRPRCFELRIFGHGRNRQRYDFFEMKLINHPRQRIVIP